MSTRLCVTMKLALFMLGGAAAKSLVPGAHPALKARFAKNEALTAADFDDASKVPMKRAVPRVAPARLGSISYNKSVEECAQFTSTSLYSAMIPTPSGSLPSASRAEIASTFSACARLTFNGEGRRHKARKEKNRSGQPSRVWNNK